MSCATAVDAGADGAELGAEFVHGTPEVLWQMINAFQLSVYDVIEKHWWRHDGRVAPTGDFWGEMDKIMKKVEGAKLF